MLADRLEQKLPVDAIEEALNVEIEHPVIAPAALAGFRNGINRRFAGPIAKGVRMKHILRLWHFPGPNTMLRSTVP